MTSKEAAELSAKYLHQKKILSTRAKSIINMVDDYTPEERKNILEENLYVSFWEVYEGKLRVIIRGCKWDSEVEEDLDSIPVEWLLSTDEEFEKLLKGNHRLKEIADTQKQIKELQNKLKKLNGESK